PRRINGRDTASGDPMSRTPTTRQRPRVGEASCSTPALDVERGCHGVWNGAVKDDSRPASFKFRNSSCYLGILRARLLGARREVASAGATIRALAMDDA